MKTIVHNNVRLWQFENLGEQSGIEHFITDRKSRTKGFEFTLSLSSLPQKEIIHENRRALAKAFGIDNEKLIFPSQVHETRICIVTSKTSKEELLNTDALITNEKGICIAVMSADCVPILLFDRKNKIVAAVHSGWRGTVARILEKTLHKMAKDFGTSGNDIIAGIGPSVSQDSYEVGEEVIEAVRKNFDNHNNLLILQENKKAKLDLWNANKIQLQDFGVPETFIEISDLCTVKNNQNFFSARKGDSGRFAAGIMLK